MLEHIIINYKNAKTIRYEDFAIRYEDEISFYNREDAMALWSKICRTEIN